MVSGNIDAFVVANFFYVCSITLRHMIQVCLMVVLFLNDRIGFSQLIALGLGLQ